ncbi:hypothetical protein DFP72DRAFT_898382 [Ephemerocybe angulata]|uniref:Uncharacterized protein n=1 Tax=Ephemerocybe angulata TaxID=980116 RepID=A0A8H6HWR0_9AGAR|nr:hypothetical protein DFP72DRAFT_898382 [Tulosesus angulatus]
MAPSSSSSTTTKGAALKSAKYKALTSARLRRRRQGIDFGEAGLGPNSIRELVADSVRSTRPQFGLQPRTHARLVLISCTTTGASRLREGSAGTASSVNHIFQGAENFVLGDVDIIAAGGNVERHRHEHIHVHIHVSTGRGRRHLAGDSMRHSQATVHEYGTGAETFWARRPTNGGGGMALHSTSGGILAVNDNQSKTAQLLCITFFFDTPLSRSRPVGM